MTRLTLLLLLGLSAVPALADGHPRPAPGGDPWTTATLRQGLTTAGAGDPERGAAVHHRHLCGACHGSDGTSPSRVYPHLAGQRPEYTWKVLTDYRDRRRDEGDPRAEIMVELAQDLSGQDIRDLAAYYAEAPMAAPARAAPAPATAEHLVRHGDPTRLLTPCSSCHGRRGEGGINEVPALAGQPRDYFIRTMAAFRAGTRANDLNDGMGQFARRLSDGEIAALADYYAGLGSPNR